MSALKLEKQPISLEPKGLKLENAHNYLQTTTNKTGGGASPDFDNYM